MPTRLLRVAAAERAASRSAKAGGIPGEAKGRMQRVRVKEIWSELRSQRRNGTPLAQGRVPALVVCEMSVDLR